MLLWMDGFDHYGTDEGLLTDGVYAEVGGTGTTADLSTVNPRTGTTSMHIPAGASAGGFRRIFGEDKSAVGVGYAFYCSNLPTDSQSMILAEFRDNGNNHQVGIAVTTSGQVFAYRGGVHIGFGAVLLDSSLPCVLAESYQHFECRVKIGVLDGAVEVRMNGVTVLNLTSVNTDAMVSGLCAQVWIGSNGNTVQHTGYPVVYIDDLYAWDDSGVLNNDFIGDKKVYTRFPDADTAVSEWLIATGAQAFEMVNNNPPIDGTAYLSAAAAPATTIMDIAAIPVDVVSIAGIMTATRAWKLDAGNAKIVVGVHNGGISAFSTLGADHALSAAPTYYHDVFETDPATLTLWDAAGFNTALVQLTRTE